MNVSETGSDSMSSETSLMEEKRERQTQAPEPDTWHLCLICGKSEMTPGTGSFYRIMEETLECYGGRGETIVKKLTDIVGFNFEAKKKILASEEICKKCLEKTTEVVRMEEHLKKYKEELVSNFVTTTYKNKTQGYQSEGDSKLTEPAPGPPMANGHGPFPGYPGPGNGYPQAQGFPQMMTNSGNFLVQPIADMNQQEHLQYGNGLVQIYPPQPYPTMRHTASEATPSVIGSSRRPGALSQEETLRARTHPPRCQMIEEEVNMEDMGSSDS